MNDEALQEPVHSNASAAERMRRHRRRRRFKRLLVRVELEPAEIEVLVERGYLDPKDRDNLGEIQAAANAFIIDALTAS